MKTKITLKVLLFFTALSCFNLNAQWTSVSSGLSSMEIKGISNLRDTLFTAVKDHGIFYSINNGDDWTAWKHNASVTSTNILKFKGPAVFSSGAAATSYFNIFGNNYHQLFVSSTGGSVLVNINVPTEEITARIAQKMAIIT